MEMFVLAILLAVQIGSGLTVGSDQFVGSGGGVPIPRGRWARLVHRAEEPAYFWTLIAVQIVLLIFYFAFDFAT